MASEASRKKAKELCYFEHDSRHDDKCGNCALIASALDEARAEGEQRGAERLSEAQAALWRVAPDTFTIEALGAVKDPFEGPGETYQAAYERVKADLDAALTLLGLSLREDNGLICFPGGPGSYDAQKRIRPLLEKRRVERG